MRRFLVRSVPALLTAALAVLVAAPLARVHPYTPDDVLLQHGECPQPVVPSGEPVAPTRAEVTRRARELIRRIHFDTRGDRPFHRLIADQELYATWVEAYTWGGYYGRIAPITRAAARRLERKDGLRQLLAGAAHRVRSRGFGADHLQGVALTDSQGGFAAATAVVGTMGAGLLVLDPSTTAAGVYEIQLERAPRLYALYHPLARWIVVGPRMSSDLRALGEMEATVRATAEGPVLAWR